MMRVVLILGCLASSCTAVDVDKVQPCSMAHASCGPSSLRPPPSPKLGRGLARDFQIETVPGRRLVLRGGSDAGQSGSAEQMALATTTDCHQLVMALMSSDNDVRSAAEKRYEALKTEAPDQTCVGLVREATTGVAENRIMSAVLARTALPETWDVLAEETRDAIKQELLRCLEAETEPTLARKTANVVGAISFAVSKGKWPGLIPALVAMSDSDVPVKREMAYHVLAILPHQIGEEIRQYYPQLSALYEKALASGDSNVHVSGLRAITGYLGSCETLKEMKPVQSMLPAMLGALGNSLQVDEANARAMLESLIEIAGMHPRFFKPQLKEIAAAMLEHVAMNKNLEYIGGEPFDGNYENAHFWRWLIARVTGQPEWVPPRRVERKSAAATEVDQ